VRARETLRTLRNKWVENEQPKIGAGRLSAGGKDGRMTVEAAADKSAKVAVFTENMWFTCPIIPFDKHFLY
jgi:hypothetical protein